MFSISWLLFALSLMTHIISIFAKRSTKQLQTEGNKLINKYNRKGSKDKSWTVLRAKHLYWHLKMRVFFVKKKRICHIMIPYGSWSDVISIIIFIWYKKLFKLWWVLKKVYVLIRNRWGVAWQCRFIMIKMKCSCMCLIHVIIRLFWSKRFLRPYKWHTVMQ